jgi:DNA-binding winged helix-turn-helix (wHTH) protein
MAELDDDFEYVFEPFRLHPIEGLFRGDEPVPLPPKAQAILLYLIQHQGRIVTQAATLRDVWKDAVIDPRGLKHYVGILRTALGDDRHNPTFIETFPRRGYRFNATARPVKTLRQATVRSLVSPAAESAAEPPPGPWSRQSNDAVKRLFPVSFATFPNFLFTEDALDLGIIAGSTQREDSEETKRFHVRDVGTNLLGENVMLSRHVSWDTPRDYVRIADLAAFIAAAYAAQGGKIDGWPNDASLCRMDVSVGADYLSRNLILVGGADTNIYIALAALAFRKKFGVALPIRFPGDDGSYFTCDQIYSEISLRTYSHLEDSSYMHCGYVLATRNPWAPQKMMILVVGTRATGTQAALLALIRGSDIHARSGVRDRWRCLEADNRFDHRIPAKVVRASRASVVDGHDFFDNEVDIRVDARNRISQRHVITDFEFLE